MTAVAGTTSGVAGSAATGGVLAGAGRNGSDAGSGGSPGGQAGSAGSAHAGDGGAVNGGSGGAAGANGGSAGMNGGSAGSPEGGGAGLSGGGAGGSAGAGMGGRGGSAGAGGTAGRGGSAGMGGSAGSVTTEDCPSGITQTITVAKSGAMFTTVQAAVDSLPNNSSTHVRIDIAAGTYKEKLTIAGRTNLCLVGAGADSTTLTYDDSNGKVGSTSGSASVLVSADDFSATKLTIENSFGSGSQAVALRTTGKRQQFRDCRFVGYQDTLYTHQGMQYFRDCYVQGNTDYVFGGATAVLQDCEVRNVEQGSAVAAPNTDAGVAYGIVFLGGDFTAVSSIKANAVALGRPWGADGFGAYLHVNLGAHIATAGFVEMSGNQPENARFHEYQSTGPGAKPTSHASYQLSDAEAANYTLDKILGGWVPSYSK